MTREEAIDIVKCLAWHTRPNEEDIEMAIKALEQELNCSEILENSPTETLVSLDVYNQVTKERSMAIQQLHELGYEFGQKIESTTKNDKVDCEHTDCKNCVNHKYCDYESTTKNDLGVDCISRQAVIDLMMQKWGENFSGDSAMQESIDAIRVMPSVTPQEPKTGHWKPYLKEGLRYQCSVCDSRFDTPWEYCPHCGAKMAETEADNGEID